MKTITFLLLFSPLMLIASQNPNQEQEPKNRKIFCKDLADKIKSRMFDICECNVEEWKGDLTFSSCDDCEDEFAKCKGYAGLECESTRLKNEYKELDKLEKAFARCQKYEPETMALIQSKKSKIHQCLKLGEAGKRKREKEQILDNYIDSFKGSDKELVAQRSCN